MKKKFSVWNLIFILGLICTAYPLVASIYEGFIQRNTIATFTQERENASEEDLIKLLEEAKEYNDNLWQSRGGVVGNIDMDFYSDENYQRQLRSENSEVMGYIEIPKISVNLPIYHGTDDEILKIGVGHFQGSSLPVGEENTRSILTGHRGLPNSKLFTRLDEMEKGDLFYLTTAGQTIAYKVNDIEVIEPDEVDKLETVSGKDLVSLITCTPYGLNTHRLIVTGERTDYNPIVKSSISSSGMSLRELIFAALPFLFIGIACWPRIKEFIKKERRIINA